MKSPTQANQTKEIAKAVFTGLRGLVSKWNREPSIQEDGHAVINPPYSSKKKRGQNTGPDHF